MISTSTKSRTRSCFFTAAFALSALVSAASAQTVVYNSIPNPLPAYVGNVDPDFETMKEFGDGVSLGSFPSLSQLGEVKVVMVSAACQSGIWFNGNCKSTPGSTFEQALTFNVYSVDTSSGTEAPGKLLGSVTQTFDLPYRPSVGLNCPNDTANGKNYPTGWYNAATGACYRGITREVTVGFGSQHIELPGRVIVTVAFNTTHAGPHPIGESAPCWTSVGGPGGCTYDEVRVSADTTDGAFHFIGAPLDPNGLFVNYYDPADWSCTGTLAAGKLLLDTSPGCWTGYHPEIEIDAAQSAPGSPTTCNGNYNGFILGGLTVKTGQVCTIDGGTVVGNISLQSGGQLNLNQANVAGNIQVNGGSGLSIQQSSIAGNVSIQSLPATAPVSQICGSTVLGGISLAGNAGSVQIGEYPKGACGGNTVTGITQILGNSGAVQVGYNSGEFILQCQGNSALTGAGNSALLKLGQCAGF